MRLFLMLVSLAAPIFAANGANDDSTALWVLNAVNGNDTNISEPTESTNDTNANSNKLNLTPTNRDTTIDCVTRDDKAGICVLYYQCNTARKTIITDGTGIFDVRTNNCPHYLEVCCKIRDIQKEQPNQNVNDDTVTQNDVTQTTLENAPNRNKDGQDGSRISTTTSATIKQTSTTTSTTIKPVENSPNKSSQTRECGWSNPGVSPFVFRDTDAKKNDRYALYGDFPWMVAILKKSSSVVWSQADYLGGGTLIHPSVVVTAAHKLSIRNKKIEANELKCRAGEWDTQTEFELYPHQERDVMKYIIHEGYYRTSLYNDIALLIVEKPFQLNNAPHIAIGCLATSLPPPGRECYSMGWGREGPEDKKKTAVILKKVLLNPIEHDACQRLLRNTKRLGPLFELHESLTCASGTKNVDSCRGDGGSSLVCAVSNNPGEMRFAVHGMVAYGIKCFDPDVPGVYVNTVHLKNWVDNKMSDEGFDTSLYTI